MAIEAGKLVLFLVLRQTRHAEASRVLVRIFSGIVPSPLERPHEIRPDQFHGFQDGIDLIAIMPRDAVLRFNAK